ncbi:unnamed protein product [Rangifer tarandus platyrhynchus]|uniref:Uncharacterized protein n=2 Tax=Rangifer tarandus platyrhynchus TaxID=3082113 RepID=A0AC60A7G0_RANTA|nr:unnamed protein product [Rangifer tarandus platyrhynchus]
MDPGMGFRQSGNLPQPARSWPCRCQEGGMRCAHLHTSEWVAPWGPGAPGVQHCSAVEGGSQLLVPNVLLVSCKRFLSYIYFVGFSIAQNTKSERLDATSPLKLCLLSERLFPPSGKNPDVALATVPLPSPLPMDSFHR